MKCSKTKLKGHDNTVYFLGPPIPCLPALVHCLCVGPLLNPVKPFFNVRIGPFI